MENNNMMVKKTLNENYLNIKKEGIQVGDKSGMLVIDFSNDTSELVSNFKVEQKEVSKRKSDTIIKHKNKLESLKKNHEDLLISLQNSITEVEEKFKSDVQKNDELKIEELNKINNQIEELKKNYIKQAEDAEAEYEKSISLSNQNIEKINEDTDKEFMILSRNLNEYKINHEANMAVLNSDINEKINKLKIESNKNINKASEEIANAEAKYTLDSEDLKFEYDYSVSKMDKNHTEEQRNYDEVTEEIKSTLESKIARHEKFMERSVSHNDNRAVKQHKKEIAILQKNGEIKLKELEIEHIQKIKDYEIKKKTDEIENIQKVAELSKTLTELREEKLYMIETYKAKMNNDLEYLQYDIDLRKQEELKNFCEIQKDNLIEIAAFTLKKENDIETELKNQSTLKIELDKLDAFNKIKLDESLSKKEKETRDVERKYDLKLKMLEVNKSIDLAKIDNKIEKSKIELEQDIKIDEEVQNLENQDLKRIVMGEVHDKNILFKEEIHTLIKTKEDFILAYEEVVYEDTPLDLEFLVSKKEKIQNDKEIFITEINNVFYPEEEIVNEDIVPNSDTKNSHTEDIQNELPIEIEEVMIDKEVIKKRMDDSLKEAEAFFNHELSRIENIINLVKDNNTDEIKDFKEKNLRVFESSSLLLLSAQLRNSKLSEDTSLFNIDLLQDEDPSIKEIRNSFSEQFAILKSSLDKIISVFETKIKSEEATIDKLDSKDNSDLTNIISDFNKQIRELESSTVKKLKTLDSQFKEKCLENENNEKLKVKKANAKFAEKESEYKGNVSKIDKVSSGITKDYDSVKKSVKKNYDNSLSSKLKDINSRLQQKLKSKK